jgi:hypothetical protein
MELTAKVPLKKKTKLSSLLSMEDLNRFDDEESFLDFSNVTEEIRKNGPLPTVGEKTKPLTISEKAEVADKKWAKLESKTEKLLIKAEKNKAKSIAEAYVEHSSGIAESYVRRSLIKRRASYVEFLCMKGIKKQILVSVREKAFQENGEWLSILDTDDIEKRTGSKANIIRDAIYRMKEEGWFEIIHSSNSGSRILKIFPEHFKF